MIDILNKNNSEQKLSPPEIIFDDFILLAYGDTTNKLKQDFIGTSKNRKVLRVVSYSNDEKQNKIKDLHTFENDILHIIPCDFNETGKLGYIITFRDVQEEGKFKVVFFDSEMDESIDLGISDRIPFLYSHDQWKNTLLLQNGETSEILFYHEKQLKREAKEFPRLAQNHSSGFIDIDGDLKADLVLVTIDEEENRHISIHRSEEDGTFRESQKIKIPVNSGPIVFADFNRSGGVDIAFISIEEDNYYLNLLLNTRDLTKKIKKKRLIKVDDNTRNANDPFKIDDMNFHKKIRLNDYFPGFKPRIITRKELNGDVMATGIFVCDININSYPDIILLFDGVEDQNKTVVRILENKFYDNKMFEPFKNQPKDFNGILSISVCDYMKTGREALIINRIENAEYKLFYIENNMSKDSYRLTALTISPNQDKRKYGSHVPGVSYKYYVEERDIVGIGNQLPQSSFLHLQKANVFFGLGSLNFMVDKLYVSGPRSTSFGLIYKVKNKILPNSDLVLRANYKGIGVELFLRLGRHVKNIIIVFILVLCFNLMLVLYSYRKEKRKAKLERRKESLFFNFQAL